MPLELEREILKRSLATKDTRHAAQTMRWRGKRERSVNSGATIPGKCLHCWKQVFVLQCSSTGMHFRFNTNNPSSALGHTQASINRTPLQCLCCSGWMMVVRLGVRQLQPDLHATRARELLHCPQEEGMRSCLSSIHPD